MKLPIPADWDGESWCRWAICWPDSEGWEAILRGFVTLPQRGWTWDERTGSILAVQETGREITAANLPFSGVLMACNDTELTTAFADIALALRYLADKQFEKPCCPGDDLSIGVTAGYAGQVTQPVGGNVIPIYGNQPPAVLPEGATFPEGFESEEEWEVHKCAIANMIFDGVLYSVAFLASLNTANITVLAGLIGAGIAGILVFPPAGIAVMVGAVAAMFGFLAMFLSIAVELKERREEFICYMYGAESVAVAISLIADALDVVILAVGAAGPISFAIKTVLLLLFNGDALNQLFDSTADYLYPDADCSGCGPELVVAINNDGAICELIETGEDIWTVNSVFSTEVERWEAAFGFNTDANLSAFTGPPRLASVSVTGGTVGGDIGDLKYYRVFNQDLAHIYADDINPAEYCGAYWVIESEFEFQLELTLGAECEIPE